MPIYEYECVSCGHRFEKMVKMGAEAPPCPECESAEIRKLVSRSGFILQGGGWYKDHYGLKPGGDSSSQSSKGTTSTFSTHKSEPAPSPKSESATSTTTSTTSTTSAAAK